MAYLFKYDTVYEHMMRFKYHNEEGIIIDGEFIHLILIHQVSVHGESLILM